MIPLPNGVIDARKAAFDVCTTPVTTTMDSAERLAALNLNTARSLMEDGTASIRSLVVGASGPEDMLDLQTSWAESAARRALAYYRSCYEILAQSIEEAAKPLEMHFAEMNKLVAANLEKAAKSAPVGSNVAIAAVQAAITAANSTFDSFTKATRQVVELTEANIANGGMAVAKAVGQPAKRSA